MPYQKKINAHIQPLTTQTPQVPLPQKELTEMAFKRVESRRETIGETLPPPCLFFPGTQKSAFS